MNPRPPGPSLRVEAHGSVIATMSLDPDLELLLAWRSGNRKAADTLLRKYYPIIRRNVAHKVPDDAVDEVVDRVVSAMVEQRDTFRAEAKLRTYVFRIMKFSIADFHRQRQRRPDFDALESSVHDLGVSPSGDLLKKEHDRVLLAALRGLPLGDQILLELYEWEEMPASELAEVFDASEPAIRSRIRRAMERLSAAVKGYMADPRELADTLTNLDDWLRQVRKELRPAYLAELQAEKKAK